MAGNPKQAGGADGGPGRSPRARSKIAGRPQATKRPAAEKQIRRSARADLIIEFIEKLIVPSGAGQGGRFKVREWQRKFIRDIYEPHGVNGRRLVRRAILSIARKNGKTALIAALVLVHLIGPESIPNGEIYSAANDREQASLVYRVAAQIVRADPELSGMLRCIDSTKTIACYSNGSFYRAMSSESGTKHGLNPTFVVFDELAQAKNRNLYDVLDTSFGARSDPLFVVISTQSNDPEHILSKLIDDGLSANDPTIVCHLYAAEEECPLDDQRQWRKANPALGDFRSFDDLKTLVAKAIRSPSEEPKTRNLYLNQRISPHASLISRAEWFACVGDADFVEGEDVYLGLDLSSVSDLTALVMVSAERGSRIRPWLWKPEAYLREHSNRDFGSGNWRYAEWHKDGHLEVSRGKVIDHSVVAMKLLEIMKRYRVIGCAYDRHKIEYLIKELDRLDIRAFKDGDNGDGLRLVSWGQGFVSMGGAIDALEKSVLSRDLVHASNPVLNWNMQNAVSVMDPAGNRKIDKAKDRFRIDGAVALAMALGLKARTLEELPVDIGAMIG